MIKSEHHNAEPFKDTALFQVDTGLVSGPEKKKKQLEMNAINRLTKSTAWKYCKSLKS